MEVGSIIVEIDAQIAKLQKVRSILAGTGDVLAKIGKPGRGRPRGSKNIPKAMVNAPKRVMSEEGRARIAAAQKKRHALNKKNAKKAATEALQEQTV